MVIGLRTCVLMLALLIAAAHVAAQEKQPAPAAAGGSVIVTVKYTGKGTVDADHRLWVWLFNTPEIGPGAIPVGEQSIEKNGGVASFTSVADKEVWVAIAYDEKGGFQGSGPPPVGSPITLYGAKAPPDKPQPVVPGPKAKVSVTFDDSQRMK